MTTLYQAREQESAERYNIQNVINKALSNKNTIHFNTPSLNNWYKGLHPSTQKLFMTVCLEHDISIVR
jgi:hypothetical protein